MKTVYEPTLAGSDVETQTPAVNFKHNLTDGSLHSGSAQGPTPTNTLMAQ